MPKKDSRIFGLDCIRALAICLVLQSHCSFLLFPEMSNTLLDGIRLMGTVGVDLFFVLSGYLIGGILLKTLNDEKHLKWSDLFRFWKRRWLRTLPNYYLVLIINIFIALWLDSTLPKDLWQYLFFIQNFTVEHPDFFTEAWSLSIEEYAYMLLPFLLFTSVLLFRIKNRKKVFFVVTVSVIVVLSFFKIDYNFNAVVNNYYDWSSSFRKVVIFRMDSIYLGFLAVFVIQSYALIIKKYKTILFLLGLLIFVALHLSMFIFNIGPDSYLWFYSFLYLQVISISLLFMFPYAIELLGSRYLKSIIEFISTRSYAMYLVNYSLILLNMQLFTDKIGFGMWTKFSALIIFLFLTITISNFIYLYFEKPIMSYRDKKFPR
ncbi:acyltransferase family protein [Aestuariivivens sediminicola]|uniref:acyltransferase family protein n=1 Tax=Aestuariivivens sediminicola TaxID=2913560 RepID=UPI00374DBD76